MKRIPRSTLIKQIDALWSSIVRLREKKRLFNLCRICFRREIAVAYHIVPKQRGFSIRWDLENGCGACVQCNFAEARNRSLYRDKHILLFGKKKIEELEAKARIKADFSTAELLDKRDELKKIIENIFFE